MPGTCPYLFCKLWQAHRDKWPRISHGPFSWSFQLFLLFILPGLTIRDRLRSASPEVYHVLHQWAGEGCRPEPGELGEAGHRLLTAGALIFQSTGIFVAVSTEKLFIPLRCLISNALMCSVTWNLRSISQQLVGESPHVSAFGGILAALTALRMLALTRRAAGHTCRVNFHLASKKKRREDKL